MKWSGWVLFATFAIWNTRASEFISRRFQSAIYGERTEEKNDSKLTCYACKDGFWDTGCPDVLNTTTTQLVKCIAFAHCARSTGTKTGTVFHGCIAENEFEKLQKTYYQLKMNSCAVVEDKAEELCVCNTDKCNNFAGNTGHKASVVSVPIIVITLLFISV